jgi:hypothetical protein
MLHIITTQFKYNIKNTADQLPEYNSSETEMGGVQEANKTKADLVEKIIELQIANGKLKGMGPRGLSSHANYILGLDLEKIKEVYNFSIKSIKQKINQSLKFNEIPDILFDEDLKPILDQETLDLIEKIRTDSGFTQQLRNYYTTNSNGLTTINGMQDYRKFNKDSSAKLFKI